MKNITYITGLILTLSFIVFSCNEFLEEEPLDSVTIDQLYDTDTHLEQAVGGIYANLSQDNFGFRRGRFQYFLELRSDAMMLGGTRRSGSRLEIATFNYNSDNNFVRFVWAMHYNAINNANLLIERGPNASRATEENKKRTIAEAHFLRAYFYFNLVRLWGSVPLVLEAAETIEEARQPSRAPVDQIYTQIIQDARTAAGEIDQDIALPDVVEPIDGRVAIGAAQTLLADIYLTLENYPEAERYARLVIDGARYALWDNYEDAFEIENQYGPNSAPMGENVFDVKFNPDVDPGSRFATEAWPRGLLQPYSAAANRFGEGYFEVDSSVYIRLDDNDTRKSFLFPKTYVSGTGNEAPGPVLDTIRGGAYDGTAFNKENPYFCVKYTSDNSRTRFGWGLNPWPVYRYADVLLMYLEAANEQSAANQGILDETINQTRARGGLDPLSAGLGQAAIREAIKEERFIEFFFEGKRFFDLVRWNDLVNAINTRDFDYNVNFPINENFELLPIPQREVDANPNITENNPPWN